MKAKLSWLTSWICLFRTYSKKSSPISSAKPTAIGRRPVSFMFGLSTSVGSSLFEPDSWCRLIGLRTPSLGQCQHTREGIKAASSFPGAECFDLRPYRDCAKIRRLTLWLETHKEDPLSLVYHGRRTRWHRHLSIDQRSSVSLSVVLSSSWCWTHCLGACSTCPPTLCNWPCGRSFQQMHTNADPVFTVHTGVLTAQRYKWCIITTLVCNMALCFTANPRLTTADQSIKGLIMAGEFGVCTALNPMSHAGRKKKTWM